MEQIKYAASKLAGELSRNLDQDYNIYYTEEYIEILKGRQNSDSTISQNTDGQILKMLIYILKNKRVTFDDDYFKAILEILMVHTKSDIIDTTIYNLLIAVLSFSCDKEEFLTSQDDKVFFKQMSNLNGIVLPLLFEIYNTNEDTHPLFQKLKKYSPVIIGIIINNASLIKEIYHHYDKPIYDAVNLRERETFLLIIASFLENIRSLNYDYSLITAVALKIRKYLYCNIIDLYDPNSYEDKVCEIEDIIAEMMEPKCKEVTKYLH